MAVISGLVGPGSQLSEEHTQKNVFFYSTQYTSPTMAFDLIIRTMTFTLWPSLMYWSIIMDVITAI